MALLNWEPSFLPIDLIFDDGEPLETNRHRIAMNVLIDSMLQVWQNRSDFFAGGNMFVYYSRNQAMNRDLKGPDFFGSVGCRWDWGAPGLGRVGRRRTLCRCDCGLVSPSAARVDTGVKKTFTSARFVLLITSSTIHLTLVLFRDGISMRLNVTNPLRRTITAGSGLSNYSCG